MKKLSVALGAIVAIATVTNTALADTSSSGFDLVKDFILKHDYPEKFKDTVYHVKINDALVSPVLNDNTRDVVVLVTPNYLQSATILIYEISDDKIVKRVAEGLAPGPLVPLTGAYLDSHTLGEAVDIGLKDKQGDPNSRKIFIKTTFDKFGGVVAYANFFHVDGREGPAWFIDMSDSQSPLEGKDCSKFEFSSVDAIVSGQIDGATAHDYLVAKVGKNLYVYFINGLTDEKFLNKKSWVVPVPADFVGFPSGNPSPIQYTTVDGKVKNLSIPALSKE